MCFFDIYHSPGCICVYLDVDLIFRSLIIHLPLCLEQLNLRVKRKLHIISHDLSDLNHLSDLAFCSSFVYEFIHELPCLLRCSHSPGGVDLVPKETYIRFKGILSFGDSPLLRFP